MLKQTSKNIILLILFFAVNFAQSTGDSLSIIPSQFSEPNYIINRFEKQINTYNLQNHLKYGSSLDKLNFGFYNEFNSTLVKSSVKNIKDNNKFSVFADYKYSPKLSFGILLNSLIFDDDRNTSINKTTQTTTILYSKYKPLPRLSFIPFGGYSSNESVGIRDNGFIYGSEFLVNHLSIDNFDIYSNLKFQNEEILPRKNSIRLANVEIRNSAKDIKNTLQIYFNQNGKDFYVATDSMLIQEFDINKNIQNRNERQYFVNEQLQYIPEFSNFAFDFSANLSYRDVSKTNRYYLDYSNADNNFDTELNEFGLNFNLSTRYLTDDLSSIFKLSYTEKEEKYNVLSDKEYLFDFLEERQEIENRKNNHSQILSFSILANYNISPNDVLSLSTFFRKLKYDTSSELNFDDRDELLTIFRLMYLRKINPFLNVYVNLEGSFNHLVYIFSQKSANNNKRRVLKLGTGTDYKGKLVSSKNSFEVSANYTTYDFRDLVPNFRNFSFRQFVAKDSTSIKLTKNTGTSFIGKLKLSEQGDFSWSDFSSKPVRYIKELYLEPKLYYKFSKIKFAIGMKYFLLNSYQYKNNEKILSTSYESIGPLGEIVVKTSQNLYFRLIAWYEFLKRENSSTGELINMNLELNWIL